jgi:chromosome segregation ATPase
MSKSQITKVELEQALERILSGKTHRVDPARKISVKAVEEEAGLGDGSAYYYKDIVQKIKESAIRNSPKVKTQNAYEDKISSLRDRLNKEIKLKEKYRGQVEEMKDQLASMASQHNQLALMIQQYQYRISELESNVERLPKFNE